MEIAAWQSIAYQSGNVWPKIKSTIVCNKIRLKIRCCEWSEQKTTELVTLHHERSEEKNANKIFENKDENFKIYKIK